MSEKKSKRSSTQSVNTTTTSRPTASSYIADAILMQEGRISDLQGRNPMDFVAGASPLREDAS